MKQVKMNTAKTSESQAKFAQNRVTQVEKHFGLFCQSLGSVTRKIGKTRDRTDTLAGQLTTFATTEKYNDFTRTGLTQFSKNLSLLQDYRHTKVQRLEEKVLKRLGAYGSKCKAVKVDIKRKLQALSKTQKQAAKLAKIRERSPDDIHNIEEQQAETNLQKANAHVAKETKVLEDKMFEFESSKLTDLKGSLMDFVHVEMLFHAKALEVYSDCFQNISEIDEDHDLEAFKKAMQNARSQTQDMSQTLDSLTSTGRAVTFASRAQSEDLGDEEPHRQKSHAVEMYDDSDDDDEDDDDDDEDMDDEEEENDRQYRAPPRYR